MLSLAVCYKPKHLSACCGLLVLSKQGRTDTEMTGRTSFASLASLDAIPDAADGLEVGLAEDGIVAHEQRRSLDTQ